MTRLSLSGACSKLDRALLYLDELGNEMESAVSRAASQLTVANEEIYPHPKGTGHLFRVGALVRPSPTVGLVVGDYVQNLRSALDHLAWELVRRGSRPPHKPNAVQFPIYRIGRSTKPRGQPPKTFSNQIDRNLPGVSSEQRAIADSYQPYHRRQWHLAVLANLSNQDKHRLITPVNVLAGRIEPKHFRAINGRIIDWTILFPEGRRVNERTKLLEVIVTPPEAQVSMNLRVATPVAFQERAGVHHRPRDLEAIGERVSEIVGEFARRWGRATDFERCSTWPSRGRSALDMETGPTLGSEG